MEKGKILETPRLSLREFDLNDSDFILKLVNSPNWLEFIGDKGVKTVEDAKEYLESGPIKSYRENGYGLWLVQLKDTNIPIGMCGLVNRETLENIDIGFAMLPDYSKLGYGLEIANATMFYVKYNLKINKVIAITDANNIASIRLLTKIGLNFEKTLKFSENDRVLVFSSTQNGKDKIEIDKLTFNFFNLFTNTKGQVTEIDRIKDLFISNGIIINNSNRYPEIFNLETFMEPRKKILNNGILVDFSEIEISHKTEIFGNIAQRLSLYGKSGNLNGVNFETKGVKTFQFIKVNEIWKISALSWCDET